MATPTGEVAIYNNPNKQHMQRIVLELDYPALTAAFSDTFAADLDPACWAFSEQGGPPVVTGGEAHIDQFGAAPRMYFYTRPGCIPDAAAAAFTIEIHANFPVVDPIYSTVFTIATIDSPLGADEEPFRVTQHGSLRYGDILAADIGKLFYSGACGILPPVANDHASHKYVVSYDPAALNVLSIAIDDVSLYAGAGPRPYYVAFGMPMPTELYANATAGRAAAGLTPNNAEEALYNGGTLPSSPVTMTTLSVQSIAITPTVADTYARPAWTFPNAGGALADFTAQEGEICEQDGTHWAIIPHRQCVEWSNASGISLESIHDTFTLKLATPDSDDPDGTPNLFAGDRWEKRMVLLDTATGTDSGDWAAWRRNFAGYIKSAVTEGDTITIEAVDRPSARLDTFLPRAFTDVTPVVGVQHGPQTVRSGLVIAGPDVAGASASVITDLIHVDDAQFGGPLGPVPYQVRLLDHAPVVLSTGGQSHLPAVQELIDRCGLQWWRKYGLSGDTSYGKHMIAARTLSGTAGFTFRGLQATGGNSNINYPPGMTIREGGGDGPGRVYMRNDSPAVREVSRNGELLPLLGIWPLFPYPPQDRDWQDSFAPLSGFGLSTLVMLHNDDDTDVPGGVAKHRYEAENAERRKFEWKSDGQNWAEPTDIVDVDDARSGLTTAEPLIVVNRVLDWKAGGAITCTFHAVTTDWVGAIRRGK